MDYSQNSRAKELDLTLKEWSEGGDGSTGVDVVGGFRYQSIAYC